MALKDTLTKDVAGIPVYAWGVGVGVFGIAVFAFLKSKGNTQQQTAGTGNSTPSSSDILNGSGLSYPFPMVGYTNTGALVDATTGQVLPSPPPSNTPVPLQPGPPVPAPPGLFDVQAINPFGGGPHLGFVPLYSGPASTEANIGALVLPGTQLTGLGAPVENGGNNYYPVAYGGRTLYLHQANYGRAAQPAQTWPQSQITSATQQAYTGSTGPIVTPSAAFVGAH